MVDGDGVGAIGLQLQRIGARGLGGFQDLQRALQAAIVIGRHLGDHIRRPVGADFPACDGDAMHRRFLSLL
jgi:hypothetical protein